MIAVDPVDLEVCPVGETYDMIHLAESERGNETMRKIAVEWFREHPVCDFVLVYEHAGWYLGFRRDLSIWDTANDRATLDRDKPFPKHYSGTCHYRTCPDRGKDEEAT